MLYECFIEESASCTLLLLLIYNALSTEVARGKVMRMKSHGGKRMCSADEGTGLWLCSSSLCEEGVMRKLYKTAL